MLLFKSSLILSCITSGDIYFGDANTICHEQTNLSRIDSVQSCKEAVSTIIHLEPNVSFVSMETDDANWPSGCSINVHHNVETVEGERRKQVKFNRNYLGHKHPGARPLCTMNLGIWSKINLIIEILFILI